MRFFRGKCVFLGVICVFLGVILQHFPGGMSPDTPRMVGLNLICDVTPLWRNLPPSEIFCVRRCWQQWLTVVILVGCLPGLKPAKSCEGSSAVVVVAYHKPFEQLNRLAVDHNNQTKTGLLRSSYKSQIVEVRSLPRNDTNVPWLWFF